MELEHPIAQYCQDHQITQKAFAELVSLSEGYVSQLVLGREKCGRNAGLQIVEKSGGEIDLAELLTWDHTMDDATAA